MTQLNKKVASQVLASLDSTGNEIEGLAKAGLIDPKIAAELLHNIDTTADRIQVAAYGAESLEAYKGKVAKVIKQDSDEPYMKTFENPQKPLQTDSDEPYMHTAPGGFNSKPVPTFDSDDTSQVSERDEYDVRDLSEHANKTTKQPSWPGGSSGKSTKQGSSRQASAPRGKSWSR